MTTNGPATKGIAKPVPERIREAREAKGYTLDAFADALQISSQAVARFESGLSSPSGETMRGIIGLTGQPPAFFVSSRQRPASELTPFWRSLKRFELHHRKRISRRLEWLSDIVEYVEHFVELPSIDLPTIEFDSVSGGQEQIERAAEKLREVWGLGGGPLRDLSAILENHGVVVVSERVNSPDMDAVSCWQRGRPYILYAEDVESGPRTAFNVAHELGHLLFHSDVQLTIETLPTIERQANRFASAFLLPQEAFSRDVLGTSLNHFLFLKEKWGVSISAMAYRCKDLGIINQNQLSYVMRQLNLKRIREFEPLDEKFKMRAPTVLSASMRMLLDNNVQSLDDIEKSLALNLQDIEALTGLPSGTLDRKIVQFVPRLRTED